MPKVTVGLVGGSDLKKIAEQMDDPNCKTEQIKSSCNNKFWLYLLVVHKFDYVFAENGLIAYKQGQLIGKMVWFFENLIIWLFGFVVWFFFSFNSLIHLILWFV